MATKSQTYSDGDMVHIVRIEVDDADFYGLPELITIPDPLGHPRRIHDALTEAGMGMLIDPTILKALAYRLAGLTIPSDPGAALPEATLWNMVGLTPTYLFKPLSI